MDCNTANCRITTDQHSCPDDVCESNDCFDIVKSCKTVSVPTKRNIREAYTVKVPKTKSFTVEKKVPYIDYETKEKQVPYQYVDRQTITKNVPVCRTFPTIKSVCTTVPVRRTGILGGFRGGSNCVRKKCPRTVYVRKKCCEPRQFCMSVQKTGWKTEKETVPVEKFRNVSETRYKTYEVPEKRYRNREVTKVVTKTVPVYKVVKKDSAPAPDANDTLVTTLRASEESGKIVLPPITILQAPPPGAAGAATTAATADATFGLFGSNGRITSQGRYAGASYAADATFDLSGSNDRSISQGRYAGAGYAGAGEGATSYAAGYAAGAADANRDFNRDVYRDFNRIDRNRDGLLSYPEISYDTADANKDGVLDYNEYSAGHRGHGYISNITGGYDGVHDFGRIDKDGDGFLNSAEVAFDYADKNKSGQLGFGEYAFARSSGILPGRTRIDKDGDGLLNSAEVAFDYADKNKSGQLDFGEYAAARSSGILPGRKRICFEVENVGY